MTRLLLILALLPLTLAHAALPEPLAAMLQKDSVPADTVAVVVQRVDAEKPLLAHMADKAMNPASVMKLLTTYAGLEVLGPAYRWRTEIYTDGVLNNGVLEGNLIIKGYGDPTLMAEDFWRLLNSLRQLGLRDIRGDLVLDNSYFSPKLRDTAVFDGDGYRAYNATANALLVNLKSTSFRFGMDGDQFSVRAEPDLPGIRVSNQLKLTQEECGDWRSKQNYKVQPSDAKTVQVTFTGSYSQACGEKYLELSLLDDATYTYSLFKKIWQQLGGGFTGGVRYAALPEKSSKLMEQQSIPLNDVVRRINKYSNNLMARQLLLTLGAERMAIPSTEVDGDKAVRAWLASKGMDFPELVLENGSGLSRIERISAQHLNDLLIKAYASPVMPEFISSLPILAVDGTTSRRLKDSAVQGRAHLKTGSIEGVRAIAGYVLDAKGRRWSVVFMANGLRAQYSRAAQDALLDWVYQQP